MSHTWHECLKYVISSPRDDDVVVEGDVPRDHYTTIADPFHRGTYFGPERDRTRFAELTQR